MNKREKLLFYSITALGISSIITQLVLIREFLSIFYGNELILGIVLANWLLLTGIGAYIGKYSTKIKNKIKILIICQLLIAILPFVNIIAIRTLRNIIFPIGTLIGITEIFVSSLVLLLPYCIISGILLTLFCVIYSKKQDSSSIGKVYFIDSIGDILGGLLFSFILIFFLNPIQMIFFIMFINLIAAFFLSNYAKIKLLKFVTLIMIVLSFPLIFIDLNNSTTKLQYPNQDLIFQKDSLYGKIVVTKTQDQLNFYENGISLFSTQNTVANEETVHYNMIQHNDPKNVLLISGGVAGTINEILKYNISQIDYVELDPLIIDIGKKYTNNLKSNKINPINQDARLYVKRTKNNYDIVIIDLPDPSTAQINRFYTTEFFIELKNKLNKGSIISLSLSSTTNYLNEEVILLNSALYTTLKNNFKNVIIIPGNQNYFIASDNDLNYNIGKLIKEKNIDAIYTNENYLKGIITQDRVNYILKSLKSTKINKDFNPISHYYHLLFWISHFKVNFIIFIITILLLITWYLTKLKPITYSIFSTGFTAASLEIILLIGFQILYGFVYHKIGVIITSFMIGLSIGAYLMNKKIKSMTIKNLIKIEYLLIIFSFALPVILIFMNKASNQNFTSISSHILIPSLTLILAILVGMEFPLAAKLHFKKISKTAADLYNADLIGACIGALLVSSLLIPILGIVKVCILVGLINSTSVLILIFKQKSYK